MRAGRNDPCPCGSGKKYKKCCWNADQDTESKKQLPMPEPKYLAAERPPQGPQPALPPPPPPPPPKPPGPEEMRWEEFKKADYPERLRLFQQTLDDGLMDGENATGMLEGLSGDLTEHNERER